MKCAQHAAHTPNSKRWDYSDIPGGSHGQIKGPAHMVEGGHHPRNRPSTLGTTSVDFYHYPVAVWAYSTPQPNTEVPAPTGGVEYVGPGFTWGRILSTYVISMWSNDIKCKCMFMFPLKNLARKELKLKLVNSYSSLTPILAQTAMWVQEIMCLMVKYTWPGHLSMC